MKIAVLNHISKEGPEVALTKVEKGLGAAYSTGIIPEILFGPDYTLACAYVDRVNTPEERQKILRQLEQISKRYPKTRIIPGTMPWCDEKGMRLSSPMYSEGRCVAEFYKQRDNGESDLAKKAGVQFIPGNCNDNRFMLDGRKIAYEICGDHACQKVEGVYVELVPTLDDHAAFHVNPKNDGWDHFGILADGITGKSIGAKITNRRMRQLEKEQINTEMNLYNLE